MRARAARWSARWSAKALAFSPLLLGCGGAETVPAALSRPEASIADFLAAHNAARAQAQPAPVPALPALTESPRLAAEAAAWAAACRFEHAATESGENLYVSSWEPKPAEVVAAWAAEAADYDLATGRCTGMCGHYTQLVWRGTREVGCAVQRCTSGTPLGSAHPVWWLVVCRYEPAGNIIGERPY